MSKEDLLIIKVTTSENIEKTNISTIDISIEKTEMFEKILIENNAEVLEKAEKIIEKRLEDIDTRIVTLLDIITDKKGAWREI